MAKKMFYTIYNWYREALLSDLFFEWEALAIDAINKLFLMFDYFKIDEK